MKRRQWNNSRRRTQCSTRLSFISKESSRLWKLKLKPSTVFKERLLTWPRKMFNLRMNLKLLTKKREFKLCLKKEKKRRIKEVKQLEQLRLKMGHKNHRKDTSSISLRARSLRTILVLRMMTSKRRWRINDLRNLVTVSNRCSMLKLTLKKQVTQVLTTLKK